LRSGETVVIEAIYEAFGDRLSIYQIIDWFGCR
jgi:hypothetical protein